MWYVIFRARNRDGWSFINEDPEDGLYLTGWMAGGSSDQAAAEARLREVRSRWPSVDSLLVSEAELVGLQLCGELEV